MKLSRKSFFGKKQNHSTQANLLVNDFLFKHGDISPCFKRIAISTINSFFLLFFCSCAWLSIVGIKTKKSMSSTLLVHKSHLGFTGDIKLYCMQIFYYEKTLLKFSSILTYSDNAKSKSILDQKLLSTTKLFKKWHILSWHVPFWSLLLLELKET